MTKVLVHIAPRDVIVATDVPDDYVNSDPTWIIMEQSEAVALQVASDKMKALRSNRDKLLLQSDWTQIADAPVNKPAWAEYRQALRDLPLTFSGDEVVWPTEPA